MKNTISFLTKELDKLGNKLNAKLAEKDTALAEANARYNSLQSEADAVKTLCGQFEQQLIGMQQQFGQYEQSTKQQTEALSGQMQSTKAQITTLTGELAAAKMAMDEAEKKLDATHKMVRDREDIIEQLQAAGQQLHSEFKQLRAERGAAEVAHQQKERSAAEQRLKLESELERLKASLQQSNRECSSVQMQYQQLQQQAQQRVAYVERQYYQLEQVSYQQKESMMRDEQKAQEKLSRLKTENNELEGRHAADRAQIESLSKEVTSLRAAISSGRSAAIVVDLNHQKDKLKTSGVEAQERELNQLRDQLKGKENIALDAELKLRDIEKKLENAVQGRIAAEAQVLEVRSQMELKIQQQWEYAQQQYRQLEEHSQRQLLQMQPQSQSGSSSSAFSSNIVELERNVARLTEQLDSALLQNSTIDSEIQEMPLVKQLRKEKLDAVIRLEEARRALGQGRLSYDS